MLSEGPGNENLGSTLKEGTPGSLSQALDMWAAMLLRGGVLAEHAQAPGSIPAQQKQVSKQGEHVQAKTTSSCSQQGPATGG